MGNINKKQFEEIELMRQNIKNGDNINQLQLNKIAQKYIKIKDILSPTEKEEVFTLVDNNGKNKELESPRWLCHLLSLRHRTVHVLLRWHSPNLGNVFILQVRSWTKADSPGHLDISVGGHVKKENSRTYMDAVYKEMEEELGIVKPDLKNGKLIHKTGYESLETRQDDFFYNNEWREVYIGEIVTKGLEKIRFNDKEVVGIYFCPELEAKNLLNQKSIPIASALALSLPKCL